MTFPYENAVDPLSVGIDPMELSKIVMRFQTQQSSGAFPGGQLVVRRSNKMVLNHVVGLARGLRATESIIPVSPQTSFPVYSTGKSLASIAIALLEERGLININAPIADILPEFSSHGKSHITTLDVLTHTAGISAPRLYTDYKHTANQTWVWERILEASPRYKRGTFAYMPWEFGAILDAIVRKIVGKTLSDFFAEELAEPLNLPNLKYGLADRPPNTLAHTYWLGKDKVMIAGVNVAENFEEINNSVELFNSCNPAFSMVTDAASLAAFYEFLLNNGLTHTGKQLLLEKTIRQYTTKFISGWNKSIGSYMSMGRGFMLGTLMLSPYGWWNTKECFGHGGAFSSLAFGDYKTGLSVAIVTNGNRSLGDFAKRFIPLTHQIRKTCI